MLLVSIAVAVGSVHCVDLFHSTSFDTSCDGDASACEPDASVDGATSSAALDFCAWSSEAANAESIRVCAWAGACLGAGGPLEAGRCITEARLAFDCNKNPHLRPQGDSDRLWRCFAAATTCHDFAACVTPSGRPTCEVGQGGSFAVCRDNLLVTCTEGDARAQIAPCQLSGQRCVDRGGFGGQCTGRQGLTCQDEACVGTALSACTGSVDVGRDCVSVGAQACASDINFGRACSGLGGESCQSSSIVRCEGTVAIACVEGREQRVDCSIMPLHACTPTDARGGGDAGPRLPSPGLLPLVACRASVSTNCGSDACSGSQLSACTNGIATSVDCAALGLGACLPGPANGTLGPACSPP